MKFDREFLEMQDALGRAKEAQRFAEVAAQVVQDRRMHYHRVSEEYGAAEHGLNEELGCTRVGR